MAAMPSAESSRTATCPPLGVNLIALERRLSITCPRRWGSPAHAGVESAWAARSMSRFVAAGRASSTDCYDSSQVDLLDLDPEGPLLDPHQQQEVADQPHLALCVSPYDVEVSLTLLGQMFGLALRQQLPITDDRGQGRAQLVCDEPEELVL